MGGRGGSMLRQQCHLGKKNLSVLPFNHIVLLLFVIAFVNVSTKYFLIKMYNFMNGMVQEK